MADDQKPANPDPSTSPAPVPAPGTPDATPAGATPPPGATDGKDTPPKDGADPAPDGASKGPTVQAEPLADGTVPTVLAPGKSHRSVAKGDASITRIYRRADILTTLLTFGGAVLASVLILGGYAYFTRSKAPTAAPKVTTLDKAELEKLGAFFDGNTAGNASQVLTISSSTLFTNRVALSSDLKVVGGLQVTGTTALGDLTVDKTTTLGVTNVRGSLTVAGPVNFQSPSSFGAGASFKGNLSTTGNASFGGSLSAASMSISTLTVTGTLNLAGHLSMSGQTPSASPGSEAGSGATANVEGNDSAGTININTGNIPGHVGNQGGLLVTLTFRVPYPRSPKVVITPVGQSGAALMPYVIKNATNFTIGTVLDAASNKGYAFDYWVVQ